MICDTWFILKINGNRLILCSEKKIWIIYLYFNVGEACVTVERVLPLKNAMSPMGCDPGTSRIVRHRSTNWAYKEICTNAVSRGGYESTTVPIILGGSILPLHLIKLRFLEKKIITWLVFLLTYIILLFRLHKRRSLQVNLAYRLQRTNLWIHGGVSLIVMFSDMIVLCLNNNNDNNNKLYFKRVTQLVFTNLTLWISFYQWEQQIDFYHLSK